MIRQTYSQVDEHADDILIIYGIPGRKSFSLYEMMDTVDGF